MSENASKEAEYRPKRLWTLSDAMRYVRERHVSAYQYHYSLCLGGEMIDRAFSDTALEIIAVPVQVSMDNYLDFSNWLKVNNFLKVRESAVNSLVRLHEYQDEFGRPVNWFVVGPFNVV